MNIKKCPYRLVIIQNSESTVLTYLQVTPVSLRALKERAIARNVSMDSNRNPSMFLPISGKASATLKLWPMEAVETSVGLAVLPILVKPGVGDVLFPPTKTLAAEMASLLRSVQLPDFLQLEKVMEAMETGAEWKEPSGRLPLIWPEMNPSLEPLPGNHYKTFHKGCPIEKWC